MPKTVGNYTPFEADNYVKAMSALRDARHTPLNAVDIIRERLQELKTIDLKLIGFWLDNYFNTPDGFAFPGEKSEFSGRFKFVPDSDLLLNIGTDANNAHGALALPDDETYVKLSGHEFRLVAADGRNYALLESKFDPRKTEYKLAELYELGATPLGRKLRIVKVDGKQIDEVVNSDLWLAFLRGDKQLLIDYRNAVGAELKRRGRSGDGELMGVYPGFEQEQPSIRALNVSLLNYGSSVNDNANFFRWFEAHLVGRPPQTAKGGAQGPLEGLVRRS